MHMFAMQEVALESLGFCPYELVLAHSVRGSLELLSEKWWCEGTEQNLLDSVSNFRFKLRREFMPGDCQSLGLFCRLAPVVLT